MSLTLTLNNALSGLKVSQQSLTVLSQNIANANTAGYSRQIVSQQAVTIDGNGSGVTITDIARKVDEYMLRAVRNQSASLGKNATLNDYAARIQLLLGSPGSGNSIDAFTNTFFNNLHSLAQNPQSATLQQQAVNSGVTLSSQMNQLVEGLQDLQFEADRDIGFAVYAVNNNLSKLAELNSIISTSIALGRSVADLEDQRDVVLNELAQYVGIQTFARSNGVINVSTTNGVSLLDDNRYVLTYTPSSSRESFAAGVEMSALSVQRMDSSGNLVGNPVDLVTGGASEDVVSTLVTGKISGLVNMRDTQLLAIIQQLDVFASTLREQINVIHNQGTGLPGAASYTGSREVDASLYSEWSGKVRIAVLDQNGQPIASPYDENIGGVPPLTIDLETLSTGSGEGRPSVQGIIDEINQYYGAPKNKAQVGNLNNIRLASDSTSLPGSPAQFSFDFDLSNLSASQSNFYITGVQVLDNNGVDITSLTTPPPSVALNNASTYVTSAGSNIVTINTASAHGFSNGDKLYLTDPGVSVDGIGGGQLSGFFTISNVSSTSFQIEVGALASAGATTGVAGVTASPPYAEVPPGESMRTRGNGIITADLTANSTAPYYTVKANVAVDDGNGNISTSTVSYLVANDQVNLLNTRFAAQAVTGQGELLLPTGTTPLATAKLVDADGNELPKINGKYTTLLKGYLQISTVNGTHAIAIDSLDSSEDGRPSETPPIAGTERGFSYYFGLNDFFESNLLTESAGSALALTVEERLRVNPSLISLGTITRSLQPVDPNIPPRYTYERNGGDNSIVLKLANLNASAINFAASSGLGVTRQTFASYTGQVIGIASTNASTAKINVENAQTLLDGYNERASSISGVNLDTELANTIIYQNSYAASARVITVTNELFNTLLQAF